jgi:Rhs element Vgr protein
MTPPSPTLISGSLSSYTIKVEGKAIPTTIQVVAIETSVSINRLPKARLTIYDGSASIANFPVSSLSIFLPGNKITIALGYNEKNTIVFSGVIVAQRIEIDQTASSKLIVDITDQAMAMTLERKSAVFTNIRDSDLIQKLITGNGLSAEVSATTTVYEDVVQYYATDWDLMTMRAELNGFVVVAGGGTVTVAAPDTQAEPVLLVEYGDSILELNAEMNAATQYTSSAIKSYAWDEATQTVLEAGPRPLKVTEPGNVSSDQLAETFGVTTFAQQTGAMLPSSSLQDWSTAELLKSKLSKIRGEVRFQGSSLAKTGSMIQLAGLGGRFNGSAFISAVRHYVSDGRWTTTVTFGLSWPWFASEAPNIPSPQASGQMPPIQGLQTGIVKQIATDPDGEFRVLITLPILGASSPAVWARLGSFYASKQFGAVFYPEVKDEVIVAFMNEDPRFPVILGSVYSKPLPPPFPPDSTNRMKAIVTREKLELTFDDQNKVLEIKTPGKRSVRLDDKAGTLTVSDDNKNTITLSSSGITIDSAKDLLLKAAGSITVQAGAALNMSAGTNATLKGVQVSHTASGSFSAQGGTAKLAATGITTISGALVNIN